MTFVRLATTLVMQISCDAGSERSMRRHKTRQPVHMFTFDFYRFIIVYVVVVYAVVVVAVVFTVTDIATVLNIEVSVCWHKMKMTK